MNILEEFLKYDGYKRTEGIDVSPSQLASRSNYQLWLEKMNTPKTHPVDLEKKVNSKIGTSVHLLLEESLKDKEGVYPEIELKGNISGYKVGGTSDVIYKLRDTYVVGDLKTVGAYEMRKLMKEEPDDIYKYKVQLSVYSYLYAQMNVIPYSKLGEIYALQTGDKAYMLKKDGGGTLPKYMTISLELLDEDEVSNLVWERMMAIQEEPEVDCQSWSGPYCEFACPHRGPDCGCD